MKNITLKAAVFAAISLFLISCEQGPEMQAEPLEASIRHNFGTDPSTCEIIEFNETDAVDGAVTTAYSEGTPVKIKALWRLPKGRYRLQNMACIFNTTSPTSPDAAFRTPSPVAIRPMGRVLALGNREHTGLYNYGGMVELDFAAMGTINLKGIHVLDVEETEADSRLEVLDKEGALLKVLPLTVTGKYGATRIRIDQAGAAKLRVFFGSESSTAGSGAIDVIEFCRQ